MWGLLASITWSHWMFISHNILYLSFSTTPSGWWSYHFSLLLKSYLQQSFQWTNLAIWSCLHLYSFCARNIHSLIVWFIVSPFWPHNLQIPSRKSKSVCTFRDGLSFLIKKKTQTIPKRANGFDSREGTHLKNLWSFVVMLICRDYLNQITDIALFIQFALRLVSRWRQNVGF